MTQIQLYDLISNSAPLSFWDNESEYVIKAVLSKVPGMSRYLSDSFIDDMKSRYKSRMVPIFMRATGEVLVKQMRMIDPFGAADPTEASDDTVYRALENTTGIIGCDGSYYYERFPLAAEFIDVMKKNFIEALTEFMNNFLASKSSIEQKFFGGKEIGRVTGLIGKGGDSHRHGRSVFGVKTDTGNFFYKPHDCKLDVLYHALITELFSDCTVAADCVAGNGCGFVSELSSAPVESMCEISRYYFNFGRLLALFHGIGAVDMHLENIIPSGVKPCAVDLETMLKPEVGKKSRRGLVSTALKKPIGRNVMRAAVLPWYLHGVGLLSPLYRAKDFDDDYLPGYGGKRFTVEGFESEFLSGFEAGYDHVMENRNRIRELFRSAQECELRYLLRNTEYYNRMREFLWTPKAISDRKEQRRILDRLRVPYTNSRVDVEEDVVKYEENCLSEGDIPYYCTTLDGADLCGGSLGEVIYSGYMKKSAREKTFEDLDQLSRDEKIFECDLIRNSLRNSSTDTPDDAVRTEILRCDDKDALSEKITTLILMICGGIAECRIRKPSGDIMFLPTTPVLAGKRACVDMIYCADAVMMLNFADKRGFSIDREVITKSLSNVRKQVESWQTENAGYLRASTDLGICGGFAQLIALLNEVPEAEGIFTEILHLVEEKQLYLIEDKKDAKALAELMIAVGRTKNANFPKADLIRDCAQRLIAFFDPESEDVLCLAASGSAFAVAEELLKIGGYKEYAKSAFARLNSLFNEKIVGWPDNSGIFKALPKCLEYSPYIGLCACMAAKVSDEAKHTAELSVKSVLNERELRYCDSLYHGNALTVRFLVNAAEALDRPELNDRIMDIIYSTFRRRDECGEFHTSPVGFRDFFDISYVFGTLGIGAAFWQIKNI